MDAFLHNNIVAEVEISFFAQRDKFFVTNIICFQTSKQEKLSGFSDFKEKVPGKFSYRVHF